MIGTKQFWGRPPPLRYALPLLGTRTASLDKELEQSIFEYAWDKYRGYVDDVDFTQVAEHMLPYWFDFQTTLSAFPSWKSAFGIIADKLWEIANSDGLWDFGTKAKKKFGRSFLSKSWQKATDRIIDHSTKVMILLAKLYTC